MALSIDRDRLYFEFPEVHTDAELSVTFHRTVRVPDDGTTYPLPPSLGRFPLRVVGDVVVLPMWQSEACWIKFDGRYPFLVKVGVGNVDAVTGGTWSEKPDFEREDYFEVPEQPWLDGFHVASDKVRQFVAAPLGSGYTVEEQLAAGVAVGGVRIAAYPIRGRIWEERKKFDAQRPMRAFGAPASSPSMGLGAGGAIEQGVAPPVEEHEAWDLDHHSAVLVELVNSDRWETLTGEKPPTEPVTAQEYTKRGYPWFELYEETPARRGADEFAGVESVSRVRENRGESPLPGNEPVEPAEPIRIRRDRRTDDRRG
ncbi:hypothetical protein [Rhodococcus phenolicus]|uniref:hypothetical protein n=1 Tax=Rhodococcus phenolicus TaxID=263849 RepID=UPI000835410C|nr:hypothetical protein [Rhodococcus phenolicus]